MPAWLSREQSARRRRTLRESRRLHGSEQAARLRTRALSPSEQGYGGQPPADVEREGSSLHDGSPERGETRYQLEEQVDWAPVTEAADGDDGAAASAPALDSHASTDTSQRQSRAEDDPDSQSGRAQASAQTEKQSSALEKRSKRRDNRSIVGRRELNEIVSLALPALGSVISDPLMSLVDTACVGQRSSAQLAALGPNTAIFNFVFQVFAFLGTGTTALIARNSLSAQGISSKERRQRQQEASVVLSNSLAIALTCGIFVTSVFLLFGPSILYSLGADDSVIQSALCYLKIRALASPAVMIMSASHGACLGQQDAWTTLRVSSITGVLNLVGDWYLILRRGWGVTGAAWATLASQYLGAFLFLRELERRGRGSRGIPLEFHGFPSLTALQPFLSVSGTLITRTTLQMVAYSFITYSAMGLGTLATATHQVALQVFWFLSYFPEPLSITAQSLIARDMTEEQRVQAVARLLLRVGIILGLVLGFIGLIIYRLTPWLFTNDPGIMNSLKPLCPQMFIAELLCAVTLVFDGVYIGSNNFSHLPTVGLVSTAVTIITLFLANRACLGLSGVWCGMSAFFCARLAMHMLHTWRNYKTSVFGEGPTKQQRPLPGDVVG